MKLINLVFIVNDIVSKKHKNQTRINIFRGYSINSNSYKDYNLKIIGTFRYDDIQMIVNTNTSTLDFLFSKTKLSYYDSYVLKKRSNKTLAKIKVFYDTTNILWIFPFKRIVKLVVNITNKIEFALERPYSRFTYRNSVYRWDTGTRQYNYYRRLANSKNDTIGVCKLSSFGREIEIKNFKSYDKHLLTVILVTLMLNINGLVPFEPYYD